MAGCGSVVLETEVLSIRAARRDDDGNGLDLMLWISEAQSGAFGEKTPRGVEFGLAGEVDRQAK